MTEYGCGKLGCWGIALLAVSAAGVANAGPTDGGVVFARLEPPAGVALKPLEDRQPMQIVVSLPLRDQAGAERYVAAVSGPANALYGRFLTPAEFGARFGADPAEYAAVRAWARSRGLVAGEQTDSRALLSLNGTARQFAALFGTRFAAFQTLAHGQGWVTMGTPRLPAALAGRVDGVIGLSSAGARAELVRELPHGGPRADAGTGPGGGYSPADLRIAYDIPAQQSRARTEVVGVFEQGGYRGSDVTTYEAQYGLPKVPLSARPVNFTPTRPTDVGVEVEAALDIEAVLAVNPGVRGILVYEDSNASFSVGLLQSFAAIAQDNLAKVISISYSLDEAWQGTPAIRAEGRALLQLAAQGQTVFASSGDYGAAGNQGRGLNAPDPGSQPLVTSVGGTALYTVPGTQGFARETVWNDPAGATGGGVSAVWPIPSYQIVGGSSVAVANGGSASMRNLPDIAAVASPYTGFSAYCADYGGWLVLGGTSLSAPLWAGMISIINADRAAAGRARVGFFNPLLYRLGAGGAGFHDTVIGDNGSPGYVAGAGYDNATGFGSVDLAALLPSVLAR